MPLSRRDFIASAAAGSLALPDAIRAADEPVERPAKTKNTKFAANVEMWWPKLPFLERLEAAAKLGFEAVEFWPFQGKDINAIADKCAALKLKVVQFTAWGFSPGLNDPANHNRFVETMGQACEVAKKLSVGMLCVVGGNDIKGKTQPEMHEQIITGLKLGAPVVEKAGMTIILEPMNIKVDHKGHCLYGADPSIKIIEEVGSKSVKLLWDIYHMYVQEGNPIENLKKGYKYSAYFQIADHPGRTEPFTGEMDYPAILKALHGLGYRGYVGVECRAKKPEAEAAQALHRADNW